MLTAIHGRKFFLASFILLSTNTLEVKASEEDEQNPVWLGLSSSFAFPYSQLFIKPSESEWDNLFKGSSIRLSYSHPLTKTAVAQGAGNQGETATNSTMQLGLKYTPLSYWFVSANFTHYLQSDLQKTWDSDWSYSFGYDDWHPYTLSLTYSNSGGNSLSDKKPRFNEGNWSLGWKFTIPETVKKIFVTGYGDNLGCGTNMSLTPRYIDSFTNQQASNKVVLSMSCKYTIVGAWYINFSVLHYPQKEQQQAWNPDYTYGFGYFDWRPSKISVQYNNYSGNRFNSAKRAKGTGEFENGSLSIAWSKSW